MSEQWEAVVARRAEELISARVRAEEAAIRFVLTAIRHNGPVARAVRHAAIAIGASADWLTARVAGSPKDETEARAVRAALRAAGLLPIAGAFVLRRHVDGAWSLYAPGSTDSDIADGKPALVAGEADADPQTGTWSRPDAADFGLARAWLHFAESGGAVTLFCYDRTLDITSRHVEYAGERIADFLAAQPNQPHKWLAMKVFGEMVWHAPDLDAETLAEIAEVARPYTDAMARDDARRDVLDAEG